MSLSLNTMNTDDNNDTFTLAQEHDDGKKAAPAPTEDVATADRERGSRDVTKRILNALLGLEERVMRMEASQIKAEEDERMHGQIESGMFISALGREFGRKTMTRDALRFAPAVSNAPSPHGPP
ncbi:unnamed protein product [Hyaloperonospora brassicae]|uniref:RxLR effector candidate protein n=1 Tax=Hyaloperonospora brassicae TaxID=162125 RepID=A0AAV0TMX1_HYABA|nr:unnamed protein product [Hyaloperonospora brassicae]